MSATQTFSWLVVSIGGSIAASKAIFEIRRSNEERRESRISEERDLAWKKAEMSKKLIDEMFSNQKITDALNIIDIDGWELVIKERNINFSVDHSQFQHILRTENMILLSEEIEIRDRIDALLFFFGHLEHFINIELILASNIMPPIEYYVNQCSALEPSISKYSDFFGFNQGLKFLCRFPEYEKKYKLHNS